MDIYIKPVKRASLTDADRITVKDVCEIAATGDVREKLEKRKLMDIDPGVKKNYLVSVMDVIKVIKKEYPDDTVSNVGEMETLVEYKPEKSRDNPYFKWVKIALVTLILFAGSATAIMSFHADAQMPDIFRKFYEIIFGQKTERPLIIDIPYSIGLALGIIVFFNHFLGRKITEDPTPIEVEMSLYETDVADTLIDTLDVQKQGQKGGGS